MTTSSLKLHLNEDNKDGWDTVVYTGSFHLSYAATPNGQLTRVTVRQHGDSRDFPPTERNRQAIWKWQKFVCPSD